MDEITATELKRMAEEAGFASVDFYGDVAGGPLSRESRLILVAHAASVGRTPALTNSARRS